MAFIDIVRPAPTLQPTEGWMKTVRAGIGLAAGVGAGLVTYAHYMEPLDVRCERLTLRLARGRGRLPAGGLRVLHVTDCHFQGQDWREHAKIERVKRLTKGLEIDLLIHTGDFLHTDEGLPNILALCDVLPTPRLGAFAVLGNHDYVRYDMSDLLWYGWRNFLAWEEAYDRRPWILRPQTPGQKALQLYHFGRFVLNSPLESRRSGHNDPQRLTWELDRRGVRVLHNQAVHLNHTQDLDLYMAGIDDISEGTPDLTGLLGSIPPESLTLLLSHNPDVLDWPGIEQADLLLAGHTHGGQIVLPWLGAAHTHSAHLSRREAAGHLVRGNTQVYVNRGLGEGIQLRFGAPPQISLLTLIGD